MKPLEPDLADIQGDILRAYGNAYDRTSYLFVSIDDAERGRAWLRGLTDRVTTAEPWSGAKPDTTLNLALTRPGLAALGVPRAAIDTFSDEFREGMAARARLLGDIGDSDPAGWESGLGGGLAHVVATINAKTAGQLDSELRDFRAAAAAEGLVIVHEEHAKLLEGSREHFGYADGIRPARGGGKQRGQAAGRRSA